MVVQRLITIIVIVVVVVVVVVVACWVSTTAATIHPLCHVNYGNENTGCLVGPPLHDQPLLQGVPFFGESRTTVETPRIPFFADLPQKLGRILLNANYSLFFPQTRTHQGRQNAAHLQLNSPKKK
jgi:hypothetical protein